MMASNEDEFTPEEIAEFEAVADDERKKLERFTKWVGQKENREKPKLQSGGSPLGSEVVLTIPLLKQLVADPETSSILRHLMEKAETSPLTKKPTTEKQKLFGKRKMI